MPEQSLICSICNDPESSLDKLQVHYNHKHQGRKVPILDPKLSQCSDCHQVCKVRGLSTHRKRYCCGKSAPSIPQPEFAFNPIDDDASSQQSIPSEPDARREPPSIYTEELLKEMLFQKHLGIRYLRKAQLSSLTELLVVILSENEQANEAKDEIRAKLTTTALLLAPKIAQIYKSEAGMNRIIETLIGAQDISKATLDLIFSTSKANGYRQHPRATATPPPAARPPPSPPPPPTPVTRRTSSRIPKPTNPITPTIPRGSDHHAISGGGGFASSSPSRIPRYQQPTARANIVPEPHSTTTSSSSYSSSSSSSLSASSSYRDHAHNQPTTSTSITSTRNNNTKPPQQLTPFLAKKVVAHIEANQLTKAMQIIDSSQQGTTIISDSDLTQSDFDAFSSLHPSAENLRWDSETDMTFTIDLDILIIAENIKKSKKEIAGCFDPWTNELIAMAFKISQNFREKLLQLFTRMLSNSLLAADIWISS